MVGPPKQQAVKELLLRWGKSVFLAGFDLSNTRMTLHVCTKADVAPLKELAKKVVRDSRLDLEV